MRLRRCLKIAASGLATLGVLLLVYAVMQRLRAFRVGPVVKVVEGPSAELGRFLVTLEPKDLR